jgi:multidrug resistance efflux pump
VGKIHWGTLMRRKTARLVLAPVLLTLVAGAGWRVSAQTQPAQIVASGFIEADQVAIASELGGRVKALPAAEGDDVQTGDVLAELDHSLADAELRVAQAKVAAAQAALARVKAGARPEDIRQAEAAVALAEANRAAADQARQDAKMLVGQQQNLDLQIAQAKAQVEVSRAQLGAATAAQALAQTMKDRYDQPFEDYPYWQSWIGLNTAGAGYDEARALLSRLEEQRRAATTQRANANAAESAFQVATSTVAQAQARLADLRAGATAEQIATVQAQVRVADAGVAAIQARLKKYTLRAPVGGRMMARNLEVGELATPGAPILTLANLDSLTLVVYVPSNRLGLVRLGAKVPVQVDGFPSRTFEGEVIHIAEKAEFVPDTVQSAEDRATLVFAVKLRLPNTDHALKPGVPADAAFRGQ